MEKTNEEYEYDAEQINIMFPNAQFTIAIDIEDMNELITDKQHLIIKSSYDCYCYDNAKKKTDYFYIKGENMTVRYVIEELIKQGLKLDCNHHFLEGFNKISGSGCEFELCVGS
jgi:hypothetical protein